MIAYANAERLVPLKNRSVFFHCAPELPLTTKEGPARLTRTFLSQPAHSVSAWKTRSRDACGSVLLRMRVVRKRFLVLH